MSLSEKRITAAVNALHNGDPVLIHDAGDREDEVDMVYAAEHITPEKIARLRNDAGGLICTAVSHDAAERLSLPFLRDTMEHPAAEMEEQAYGDRSSFSLWVNHDDTYTGITDQDRATTIQHLADAAVDEEYTEEKFADDFTTPGHVAVLRAAEGLLAERQGHTEMGVYLARKAYCAPAAVVCEMLDDDTGEALSKEDAEAYAEEHDFMFLSGEAIIRDFKTVNGKVQL